MNNDILPFWQEIGTSVSIISKRVSEKLKIKTSHTGTLDPLATGVVLVITGEDSQNKEKYIQEKKEYEFEIVLGFDTDTHDAMGLIQSIESNFDANSIDKEKVAKIVKEFEGNLHQKYPDFSSKKIEGKSLWEYKRLGLPVPEIFIHGEIFSIKVLNIREVLSTDTVESIKDQISKVSGNFRQEDILQNYNSAKFPDYFVLLKVQVVMSRGLYVRGLVRDICIKLNHPGIVFNLVRKKDGKYEKKDCRILSDFFAEELKKDKNFLTPNFINL